MVFLGIYEGEWKDNKQHGFGTFTYCNKDIYKGYFKDGSPHGHGLLRKGNFMANSASLYIGEWDCGKKSGYGVMDDISTGQKYLGCWSECKREGSGLIVTSEGTYYEGNFHNDLLSVRINTQIAFSNIKAIILGTRNNGFGRWDPLRR